MIVKIFGGLDLITAILFWISATFNFLPSGLIMILALYLIAKGAAFLISKDIASVLDIIAGVIIFISLSFQFPTIVVTLVTIYLLQKGVFSLL